MGENRKLTSDKIKEILDSKPQTQTNAMEQKYRVPEEITNNIKSNNVCYSSIFLDIPVDVMEIASTIFLVVPQGILFQL